MAYKKFTRSSTDKKIAGVCGGIAQYFDCDPTIIRILFLFLVLFGGGGLLAYIIIAIIAPAEENNKYLQ